MSLMSQQTGHKENKIIPHKEPEFVLRRHPITTQQDQCGDKPGDRRLWVYEEKVAKCPDNHSKFHPEGST